MKNKKCFLIFILAACFLLLSACMPPNYTNKHKKEITSLHKADAENWFAANLPDAKMTSGSAYATGCDLYAVISGKYKYQKQEYNYYYDYVADVMYLGHEYDAMTEAIHRHYTELFGISSDRLFVSFEASLGTAIPATLENDNYSDKNYIPEDGMGKINCEKVLPFGMGGEEYAQKLLDGEDLIYAYSLSLYVDEIPDYDHELLTNDKNLKYISYKRPIDWNFQGIYSAVYYKKYAIVYSTCIKQLSDDLYGGYMVSEELLYNENTKKLAPGNTAYDDQVTYRPTADGEFELQLPPDTTPILFSKNKAKYYDYFVRTDGKVLENEIGKLDKNISKQIFDGYDVFGASFYLPKSDYYGYSMEYMRTADDGLYTIKQK